MRYEDNIIVKGDEKIICLKKEKEGKRGKKKNTNVQVKLITKRAANET
jgi:hypothetical protein